MLRSTIFALAVVAAPLPALADPNSIAEHYHAYNAALQRGDFAAAESEAGQALTASQNRDGEGGRTGVLALNLAMAHLLADHGAAAIEPARLAARISRTQRSGVDPALAEIILGRAELAAGIVGASDHLAAALHAAQARADLKADLYDAATDLGIWGVVSHNYAVGRQAWTIALDSADGATINHEYARALAETGLAASIIPANRRLPTEDAIAARAALRIAFQILRPLAYRNPPSVGLNAVQRAYARAVAWWSALRAIVNSERISMPPETAQPAVQTESATSADDTRPACPIHIVGDAIVYPSNYRNQDVTGSVVLAMRIDESGAIQHSEVAAAVGPDFIQAVVAGLAHAHFARDDNAPAGCRMERFTFIPITFSFGR